MGGTSGCALALLPVVFASVLSFSGIIFGWAPLQHWLLGERQFHELCGKPSNVTGSDATCPAQLSRLNLVYTLGTFALSAVSLPGGWFLDTYGVRAALAVGAAFEISGLVLLALADSLSFDVFIPASLLVAAGGLMTMLSAFPAAFLFAKRQTVILASISCLFDASSIVFAILTQFKFLGRRNLLLGYAGWAVLVYLVLIVLWSKVDFASEQSTPSDTEAVADVHEPLPKTSGPPTSPTTAELPLHRRPLRAQLCTFQYLFIVLFASVHQLRANAYVGINEQVLVQFGDTGTYAAIFGWALPAGIIFVPLIEYTVQHLGLHGTLHVTNLLGIAYGVLAMVPSLNVQLVTFAVFTCFRAFLYAVMSAYNMQTFGFETLGRMTGCVFTTSALINLLQYPLQTMIAKVFNGDTRWASLILVTLCAPVLVLLIVRQAREKEKSAASGGAGPSTPLLQSPIGHREEQQLNTPWSNATPANSDLEELTAADVAMLCTPEVISKSIYLRSPSNMGSPPLPN